MPFRAHNRSISAHTSGLEARAAFAVLKSLSGSYDQIDEARHCGSTTYKDEGGRVVAFEVDNLALSRSRLCRKVSRIPGARITRRPEFLSWWREEVFCEFELDGLMFEAWESYGDNSRYWIGPEPVRWIPEIEKLRSAFVQLR